jgi:hypothetical protein
VLIINPINLHKMKNSFSTSLCLAFLILAVTACKKDDNSLPDYVQTLTGGWKFINALDNEKYLQIYTNSTFSMLTADKQGLRSKSEGVLLATGGQIMFDEGSEMESSSIYIYNYGFKGDTLILSKPGQAIKLVRDKSAPDTSQWIKSIAIVAKTRAPISGVTDISYDGTYLWYGNAYSSNYVYKINPTGFAKDSVSVTQSAWAIEADGAYLWVSSNGSSVISKLDKSTGNTISTSISMGSWIYGIAKNSNFLWCYSHNENTLYKYNTNTNTIAEDEEVEGDWGGLAFVNNNLYITSDGKINKCTTSPVKAVSSFELPGYYIYGIAYDGNSFWVSGYKISNTEEEWPEIIKLSGVE